MNPSDSPAGDNGSDFNGGVNDATPPTVADAPEYSGGVNAADAPVAEVAPEFTGTLATNTPVNENGEALLPPVAEVAPEFTGTLATNTPVNENGEALLPPVAEVAPEYTGGVNSVEAAINEVPQYTLTTAGTNKDNTYQAPAVKTEDKKELPNTGGKDNVAVASLGFLGLFLGAIPFVKRKN